MIARFELRVEAHRGYRPRVSLRRVPRPGDRMVNGGEPGFLVACRECSGDGVLHVADQGVGAPCPPAGKNDLDVSVPAPVVRPDDAAEAAAREYFGPDYEAFAAHGDHPGTGHLVAFRAGYERALPLTPPPAGVPVNTETIPDRLARAHPLHAVITEALRWPARHRGQVAAVARIWGRGSAASVEVGAAGNVWAGDPEDVADVIVRAIAVAPPHPDTADAWYALRARTRAGGIR